VKLQSALVFILQLALIGFSSACMAKYWPNSMIIGLHAALIAANLVGAGVTFRNLCRW